MDTQGSAPRRPISRRWLGSAGLIGAGLLAGGILAGSHLAGAAPSSGSNSNTAAAAAASTGPQDPASMRHGPDETLLTGSTASKVTAAAKTAVPGATIIRVETDSSGHAYEAHMQKSDGSFVTVYFDKSFKVTGTVDGFGGPPPGDSSGSSN